MPVRSPLTIAVAQPLIRAGDVAANAREHAAAIRSATSRVVVFPELSLTGYEFDAQAVDPGDPRLVPIIEACRETGAVALAGAPVPADGGSRSIAMLAIEGSGVRVAYRKIWLGGTEPQAFSAGTSPAVIEVDGWRLGLAVCRDTGIPQHAAATAALGMDVYVAGVLETADDAGVPEERARRVAADHGVWVAIASFAGATGGGYDRAAGGSLIVAPDGTVVAQADARPGAIARAQLPSVSGSSPSGGSG